MGPNSDQSSSKGESASRDFPSRMKVVLVRPRDPNNIGAAARAMKNFGVSELVVVSVYPPIWEEVVSAVHATDIIANACVVGTLAEAVADCTLVVGTTDRTRVEPRHMIYTPEHLRQDVENTVHHLALVFGSEKHGLTKEDLSHCHRVMSIPTQPDCPSMNLGQAVAVCCYELARASSPPVPPTARPEPATAGEIETAVNLGADILRRSEFISSGHEPDWRVTLRRSIHRFNLTRREVHTLCGALKKITERLVE